MQVNNELSTTCPVDVSLIEREATRVFTAGANTNESIQQFLTTIAKFPELQSYKLSCFVTEFNTASSGPLKTFTGSFWNVEKDGCHCFKIDSSNDSFLINLIWIST